jgi:hypothetical protein
VSNVSNRLRDFQITGRCSLHGRNSGLASAIPCNRGRSVLRIAAVAQERNLEKGRDRCPLRFKGVGFLVLSRDPLVLVVLSRMTFGISNYEHLVDAGLSNMFPSFVGPQCFVPVRLSVFTTVDGPTGKSV